MLRLFFCLLASLLALVPAVAAESPSFTEISHQLETQPLPPGARLVYWDQAAADAVGLATPTGRAGGGGLEAWVLQHLGLEVKEGAQKRANTPKQRNSAGPVFSVERDGNGAAGRAAYVQLGNGKWVNLKGVGRTRNRFSPPIAEFSSHADGALTLEEAIKEAVYARVSDNELSRGSSRVVGILYTGRTMRYPDGKEVPLATVIRAPMARVYNAEQPFSVAESLAELNANRMLKGDFVNSSNLGFAGQMIDFGCMTHTCGYANVMSPERAKFLFELAVGPGRSAGMDSEFLAYLGYHLTNQMGVPEAHLPRPETDMATLGAYTDFGTNFRETVLYSGDFRLMDFGPVDTELLRKRSGLDQMMPRIAYEFFRRPGISRKEYARLLSDLHEAEFAHVSERGLSMADRNRIYRLYQSAYDLLTEVKQGIREKDFVAYAEKIKKVAEFKNRDLSSLARPNVMRGAGEAAAAFQASRDPAKVQGFVDHLIHTSRLGTSTFGDGGITLDADAVETRVLFRADRAADGSFRLFSHPEATAREGESFHFRLSTDDWRSFRDYPAEVVNDPAGRPYFQVRIPHGDGLPVTEHPLRFTPFLRAGEGVRWPLPPHTSLEGPPLFLNERLGLPADQVMRFDPMAEDFRTPVRPWVAKQKPARMEPEKCPGLFRRIIQSFSRK